MGVKRECKKQISYRHTPLNGFPILYCTKWHPKLLRFLDYKATGFFQLLNFFKDHNIGEPMRRKKEVGQRLDFSLACRLKRQGLDAK